MDIRCYKTGCRHNNGLTCEAKFLGINTRTVCESFVRADEDKNIGKLMFEAAPEFANSRHIGTIKLSCQQYGCLFNNNGGCSANGITVVVANDKPACATYILDEPTMPKTS
ncbi:MAG: DUF1540 domain-containing protein [Clostridia bacterium]|nr:DUF1540 domain-containing protein [Clostridia bacterium]